MIPHGTPDARCSAAWQSRAMSSAEPSAPRASATAISSAALEDSPAPIGIVVETLPSNPVDGRSSATTPATYRAQSGCDAARFVDVDGDDCRFGGVARVQHHTVSTALAPHVGPSVDRHRHDQAARVVGVVADEVHAPGRAGDDHADTDRNAAAATSGGTGLKNTPEPSSPAATNRATPSSRHGDTRCACSGGPCHSRPSKGR